MSRVSVSPHLWFCIFTGGAVKSLAPCSSLPLFVASDMSCCRDRGAFLKKDAVNSRVAGTAIVNHDL